MNDPPSLGKKEKPPVFGTAERSRFWFNHDSCGIICAIFTWVLIIFGVTATHIAIIPQPHIFPRDSLYLLILDVLSCVAFICHIRAMMTDPGAVPKDASPLTDDVEEDAEAGFGTGVVRNRKGKRWTCRRCSAFKPIRAHHCSVCGRCIIKMDHHCPWVNNCVGIGNHKYFILFLFYIFLLSVQVITLIIRRFRLCHGMLVDDDELYCATTASRLVLLIFLFLEGILFAMFTATMMFDQWKVINSNLTKIDRLKGSDYSQHLYDSGLVDEVFGGESKGFRWHWLLPIQPHYPASLRDEIFGYKLKRKRPFDF